MKRPARDRILARKATREKALLDRVNAKRPPSAPKMRLSPSSASETSVELPEHDREKTGPALSSVVAQYVDEYTAAQVEISRQRDRLIALRGGEDLLTEEDHEALENIRDIVVARYERLLEV